MAPTLSSDSSSSPGPSPSSSTPAMTLPPDPRAASKPPHKRTKSGGLLGNFSFLRSRDAVVVAGAGVGTAADDSSAAAAADDDDTNKTDTRGSSSSLATVLRQNQGRKRRGSLRKAAMAKMRERSGSISMRKPKIVTTTATTTATTGTSSLASADADDDDDDDTDTPRRFSYDNAPLNSSSESGWLLPDATLPIQDMSAPAPRLASPITSPVGPYASTTDEDDALTFFRPPAGAAASTTMQRRRSIRSERRTSLTIVQTASDLERDDEWDYSETEWWGWVMLIVTWVVFVVGMGSCLGVWSWAWDVGETPYAPPELEDDESLPITGYYPALMVCTAVMSWVWVVVAWVGMKYFRHSKMVGDD